MQGRSTHYHFVDRWRLRGSEREVADILSDVTAYPRWWPSTYLSVTETAPGDERRIGRAGSVHARGWLPYTIRFDYRVVDSDFPRRFSLIAEGDLTGMGTWDIRQDGEWEDGTYAWVVQSDKRSLRYLSWLLKPVFRSNHAWTMRKGEQSMALELERRRATSRAEAAAVPAPPGPTPTWLWPAGLVALALGGWLAARVAGGLSPSRRGDRTEHREGEP